MYILKQMMYTAFDPIAHKNVCAYNAEYNVYLVDMTGLIYPAFPNHSQLFLYLIVRH